MRESTRRRGHNRPSHRVQLDKGDDPGLRVIRNVASVRILGDAPRNLIGQRYLQLPPQYDVPGAANK
jgi:hypothetical protein